MGIGKERRSSSVVVWNDIFGLCAEDDFVSGECEGEEFSVDGVRGDEEASEDSGLEGSRSGTVCW
jgi:hypothetical protein